MDFKKLILFLLIFFDLAAYSQQNNNWYFGAQAGLNFSGAVPTTLSNGVMNAPEGCSSISDKSGNLLFYTNGVTVYNRNHQTMLNGTGLLGHVSAFQSCVIVPVPNGDSLFYIFTTDAWENNFANGYRYHVVNMNHDNGKGEVIFKNGALSAPSCERLTAARHANGVDVWVIGNDKSSNIFRSWLITCNGLQTTPVVSTVGIPMTQHEEMNFGSMKVSPDGKQLCQTHFPEVDGFIPENFFQLFEFNNATGILSNPKQITVPAHQYYACEYSPDSKLVYVSKAGANTVDQFEATLGTTATVINSVISIPADYGFYGLQLGPDKQIYLAANRSNLSVISQPNIKGIGCNFLKNQINLGTYAGINLPSSINDLAANTNILFQVVDSCNGVVQFFGQTTMGGSLQYFWDFGDGVTSTVQNPLHDFPSPTQVYKVKLKITSSTACGLVEQSINLVPGGAITKADFDFVAKCDSGYVRFANNSVFTGGTPQYDWQFGDNTTSTDKDPIHTYTGSGNFIVKLKVSIGQNCLSDSITKTINLQQLNIQVPTTQTIDAGQSVQLFVNGGANHFQWTPTTWLNDPMIANPIATPRASTTYIVTASNDAGCVDIDSVFIKVNPIDGIYVPSGFTPNMDGKNEILRPTIGLNLTLVNFSIYNRWGQKLFETNQNEKGWDGKWNGELQGSGAFVWIISVKDMQGKLIEKKGSFVLIR
jgi:gliding motility-associated-like protein